MTAIQKQALHELNERNIGAIRVESGWVWPEDLRQSEEVAKAVLRTLFLKNARGMDLTCGCNKTDECSEMTRLRLACNGAYRLGSQTREAADWAAYDEALNKLWAHWNRPRPAMHKDSGGAEAHG